MPVFGRKKAGLFAAALFLVATGVGQAGRAAPPAGQGVAVKAGKKPPAGKATPKPRRTAAPRVETPAPRALTIDLPLATRRLAGGVLVIAVPSATAQIVAVTVAEGAGASSDPADRGGLASLRARLDGTRATAERRAELVEERGGEAFIHVESEQVVSHYVLPAGELTLPLWLERDRLEARVSEETLVGSLRAMTEARERDRASRHRSALAALVFSGYAPYAHDPDGTADELLAIRNDAVAGTLASRPARPVVVVITGAITADSALLAADAELAGVVASPRSGQAGAALAAALPDQTNQREATTTDGRTATGTIWVGFAIPAAAEADHAAIEVAAAILADGPRSRLQRTLIDDGVAHRVDATLDRRRGASLLWLEVDLAPGADPVRARELTERTILDLAKSSPPPGEVSRAVSWLAAERVRTLSDPSSLATEVARMALREPDAFAGPKGAVRADLDRWSAVDGDAVARVVSAHLSPIRRSVLEVKAEHPLDAPTGPSFTRPASMKRGAGVPTTPRANTKAQPGTKQPPAKPPAKGGAGKPTAEKPAAGKPAPPKARGPAKKRGKP